MGQSFQNRPVPVLKDVLDLAQHRRATELALKHLPNSVPTTAKPNGITDGLPSSNEKHLVERFALDADRQSLLYSFELTDPVYLAEPVISEMRWLYRPNVDFKLVPCDPDATQFFLDN